MNEEIDVQVTPDEESERLRGENEALRSELICARLGIPAQMTADIMSMAKRDIEGGMDKEEAYGAAFSRAKSYGAAGITTGMKSENASVSDDALRRAFGLN